MTACLARQPIFDLKLNTIGYELLYRSSPASQAYDAADPDQATSATITMGLEMDLKRLTGNRLAFINFTENLLLSKVANILPQKHLVIEILEDIRPDAEILTVCKDLKKQGYLLSLDDFKYDDEFKTLLNYIDIVKLDFINRSLSKIEDDVRILKKNYKLLLLAEKIETREMFETAKKMGFSYFQGYFFSRPQIITEKKLTPLRATQLQLIRHAMDSNVDYRKLSAIIKNDVVLTYRILRLVNSAYYGMQYEIKNIRHALAILGINNIRKYVTLLALEQMSGDKPEELMLMSLVRGHFLESLAPLARMRKHKDDLFLLGLFSLMDVLSDTPIDEIIEKTKITPNVADSLTNQNSAGAELLSIITNYEKGNWDQVIVIAKKYCISLNDILRLYIDSIEWATEILQ